MKDVQIITAADGNATAIQTIPTGLTRQEYANRGKSLMSETGSFGVEQCGFLVPADRHFEMSGGEFCGNAARAAAILFSQAFDKNVLEFTMSGAPKAIQAKVKHIADKKYDVSCLFKDLKAEAKKVMVAGQPATLVDLGGIVHVVIEADFPDNYENQHRQITQELDLINREAVGVCWITKEGASVTMHPVVWVKDIDSFFYEGSCGSGTIAVGKVTGLNQVIQPTGKSIDVKFEENDIQLHSQMEITHEF